MINWDEFEHIHVIRKLKQIVGSWWNIDILFADDRGKLKLSSSESYKFSNPSTTVLLTKEPIVKSLEDHINKSIESLKLSDNRFAIKRWDEVGYDIAVFPIIIENDFMGCVLAVGFIKDASESHRLHDIKERLAIFGLKEEEIQNSVSKVKVIHEQDREHFVDLTELISHEVITLHLEIANREDRIKELNKELGSRYKYDNMIGKSKAMQNLYSLLDKIKISKTTVLIQGENGTGKELIAKSIHYNSPRKNLPFIIQNCSAFNDNLLESELFGHVKGSFTGAIKDKKGLFEAAHKGTFFLDEIGDTSPQMQVKLLRVLQEGTFLPVGATEPRHVDVRIVAATNRKLKEMVEKGEFREDLYYRLNVINLLVPPLRDRKEDIPLLAETFLNKGKSDSAKKTITRRALEKLYDYHWPGNVRELQNEMERINVLGNQESKITIDMLSSKINEMTNQNKIQGARISGKLKDALEELERNMIHEGLRRTGWNKSRLAKELGISRAGLIMKVEKYSLEKRVVVK